MYCKHNYVTLNYEESYRVGFKKLLLCGTYMFLHGDCHYIAKKRKCSDKYDILIPCVFKCCMRVLYPPPCRNLGWWLCIHPRYRGFHNHVLASCLNTIVSHPSSPFPPIYMWITNLLFLMFYIIVLLFLMFSIIMLHPICPLLHMTTSTAVHAPENKKILL